MKRKLLIAAAILGACILYFLCTCIAICRYSTEDRTQPADVAIVLGASIIEGKPSPVFTERINHAVRLYNNKTVRRILFTGGVGEGNRVADSEVAKSYAMQCGVPARDILTESASRTTWQNLTQARAVMTQERLASALIVSDPLHQRRAVAMATDLEMTAFSSPTTTSRIQSFGQKAAFMVREAYLYQLYVLGLSE